MFPAILILFILQVMLLPVMIGLTYAVPAERPEHILTYRTGSLVWDKAASVRPDGSAELSFFETLYKNVNADNAERVLAPGTEKDSVIRLKNDTNKEITYTAVLYSLSTSQNLDIGASLSGNGFSDTSRYALPESIKKETVVRAVGGSLAAKKLQDFDINWFWNFEDGASTDGRDGIDTYLGNKAANEKADEILPCCIRRQRDIAFSANGRQYRNLRLCCVDAHQRRTVPFPCPYTEKEGKG